MPHRFRATVWVAVLNAGLPDADPARGRGLRVCRHHEHRHRHREGDLRPVPGLAARRRRRRILHLQVHWGHRALWAGQTLDGAADHDGRRDLHGGHHGVRVHL